MNKDASIYDSAAHKGMPAAPRAGGLYRRGGVYGTQPALETSAPTGGSLNAWRATVGGIPHYRTGTSMKAMARLRTWRKTTSATGGQHSRRRHVPSDDDSPAERQEKMDLLKENTRLERKGRSARTATGQDCAPHSANTGWNVVLLFPGSSDQTGRQAGDVRHQGGSLEVKCKFNLREMMYRGNLGCKTRTRRTALRSIADRHRAWLGRDLVLKIDAAGWRSSVGRASDL